MDMKNMKMSDAEKKEYQDERMGSTMLGGDEVPEYPEGLELCLDEENIAKLGIKELPKVGQKVMIQAVAVVCCVEQEMTAEGQDQKIEMQITDMAVEMQGSSSDMGSKLYGAT